MMGRRGVGMRPRLIGAKGNNFSHFSLSYACFFIILRLFSHYPTPVFSLSYACFFIILRPKKSYNSKINLHNSKKSSIFARS